MKKRPVRRNGPKAQRQGQASGWGGAAGSGGLARILVPLDFSGTSRRALEYAIPLARTYGAKILLLHVVQLPVVPTEFGFVLPDRDDLLKAAKKRLQEMARKLIPQGLAGNLIVKVGVPYLRIEQTARDLEAGLIVITTHGYRGLQRALIGSTAERVVRLVPCPVLVVRRP